MRALLLLALSACVGTVASPEAPVSDDEPEVTAPVQQSAGDDDSDAPPKRHLPPTLAQKVIP